MKLHYNENVAALTWEIVNYKKDIGKWKLSYYDALGNFKEVEGIGFVDFINAARQISDRINVIYTKRLKWLVQLSLFFINYKEKYFFADGDQNFFYISMDERVELRDWDNFLKKVDNNKEFLDYFNLTRNAFHSKKDNKQSGSIEKNYNFTMARDMWEDLQYQYYLKSGWAHRFCEELLPQDEDEWNEMFSLDRAGFYFQNPNYYYINVPKVHQRDISSAFLSYLFIKKFPLNSFKKTQDSHLISTIIKKKFFCWHGWFVFKKLNYKTNPEFKIDLRRFGMRDSKDSRYWYIHLTNVDAEWFSKAFTWEDVAVDTSSPFYYSEQKELPKNYAEMFKELYSIKKQYKKGTFAKQINKFRAELPFGQSIKAVEYDYGTIYDEEENEFKWKENDEKSFAAIKKSLMGRGIPYYVGLWVAAYARLEFFNMINRIGIENVVYGDVDSVKFVGDKGNEIVEEYNKEIKRQLKEIIKKRHMEGSVDEELGQWIDEGDAAVFKSIALKWYLTESINGEFSVKASGANTEAILEYIKNSKTPFQSFSREMIVPKMFTSIFEDKDSGTVCLLYKDRMDKKVIEQMIPKYTNFYYYDYNQGGN